MGRTKRTIVIVAFTLVSCSSRTIPAATPTSVVTTLRLFATTAAAPLMNDLAASYSQLYPYTFDIVTGNYRSLLEGMNRDEIPYFLSNHLDADTLWAAPVGQDGIALIVHPDNPLPGLTVEQLRSIYQGYVPNWNQLGGHDAEVSVISREDGSGTRVEFEQLVMGDRRTTLAAQIAPSSSAVVSSVARLPGGIGYVSMAYVDASVRSLMIDGAAPTPDAVYGNTYPLRSTLYFIGRQEPQDEYRVFIGWVQSPAGQAVVARHFAPLLRS
jgi:ABC-type phosphate transport system substrate-binding protein